MRLRAARFARRRHRIAALLVCLGLGVLAGPPRAWAPSFPTKYYLVSCNQLFPFGSPANDAAMSNVFGSEGVDWMKLCFKASDPASLFRPGGAVFMGAQSFFAQDGITVDFVFIDGSDLGAADLEAFLEANQRANTVAIRNWLRDFVGRLFLNFAPAGTSGTIDFPFSDPGDNPLFAKSVSITYGPGTDSAGGRAVDPSHPIFNRPFEPITTEFSGGGFFFARAFVTASEGPSANKSRTVITQVDNVGADLGRAALLETAFGSGLAFFGAMTPDSFHQPQPQAANLRANILRYAAFEPVALRFPTGGGPGGSSWVITNDGGTNTGQILGDFCGGPGLAVADGGIDNNFLRSGAFDKALTLWVGEPPAIFVAPPTVSFVDPGTYTAGPVTLGGLEVTVQYFAAASSATMRMLATLHNPGANDVTRRVRLVTNLGSDQETVVRATSSGDTLVTSADRWAITSDDLVADQGEAFPDPVVTHVLFGPGSPLAPPMDVSQTVFDCAGTEGLLALYEITVPAGQTRSLLFFVQLNEDVAAAQTAATGFDQNALPGDLLSGFDQGQLGQILNWDFAGSPPPTPPPPAFPLTVVKAGSGGGQVTSTPVGIACGDSCAETFDSGTLVTLSAAPDLGSLFVGWLGAGCAGAGICQITVTAATTVTASFIRLATLTLLTAGGGAGSVAIAPAGISCATICAAASPDGTLVTLTPTAAAGSVFTGWSGGGCGGLGPCALVLTGNPTVTATFEPAAASGATALLQVQRIGLGTGTVTSAPAGIACGLDCVELLPGDTTVRLVPAPAPGSRFLGFGGDPDCADGMVTLTGSRFCTAAFAPIAVGGVSVGPGGLPGDGESQNPATTPDGRFVAFDSTATNLVAAGAPASGTNSQAAPGCATGVRQVFVRDRDSGVVECVSVAPNGDAGNLASARPAISADGRFVAFESTATNLVPTGCTTGGRQIFVRDRESRVTTCLSVTPGGASGNASSSSPAISADGRFVAFQSNATTLVPGVCASGVSQLFVRDRVAGTTECVSLGPGGVAGNLASSSPAISADGTAVVFESSATNLVGAGCTSSGFQIFVRDRVNGTTQCVSVGAGGVAGNAASGEAAVSANGQVVVFQSTATNLAAGCTTGVPQIFARDRAAGTTVCVSLAPDGSPGDGPSFNPAVAGDGSTVVFASTAGNLPGGGSGAAARVLGQTTRFSQVVQRSMAVSSSVIELLSQAGGAAGNGASARPVVSADGSVVVFQSRAPNLRPAGSTNVLDDVVVVVRDEVPDMPRPPADRPVITSPPGGSALLLTTPSPVTFAWTEVPGAAAYGVEFTCPNRAFAVENAAGPDAGSGFGSSCGGGGFPVSGPGFTRVLDPTFPFGVYRIRVIALDTAGRILGTFSNALTLFLGPVDGQPAITSPGPGTIFRPGDTLTLSWTSLHPAITQYFVELSCPDRPFAVANDVTTDPANGFGSACGGAGGAVPGTGLSVAVPPGLPAGSYQIRVIGLGGNAQFVGRFSDAVTVIIALP